jgi:hypothetical protein
MADDKVVIGLNEGTPVKPGDMTRITSVTNTDSEEDDSIATTTIPRMKIKPSGSTDAAETSNINKGKINAKLEEDKSKKKTNIKLKPAVAGETAEAVVMPSQASAAPRILSSAAPAPMPAQATAIPKTATEDETVKIHKPRPVIASSSVSSVLSAPAAAYATSAPPPAAAKPVVEDETVRIQKPHIGIASGAVPGVKQTIKLRPSSTTPAPLSEAEAKTSFTPPPPPPPPPPPSPLAPPAPPVSGAADAKRTIRLVPKKSDATSGGDKSPVIPPPPSAQTIKLEEPSQTPMESTRSALTIKLPSEVVTEAPAETAPPKRTLKLKSAARPPEATTVTPRPVPISQSPFPQAAPPVPSAPMPIPHPAVAVKTDQEITDSASEEGGIPPIIEKAVPQQETEISDFIDKPTTEPSIIFTIAACAAFFVMAYFTWMLVGQYCNNYLDANISVPGLSGKVK